MEYILIGKIVNTHGINGELKVESYTDFYDERFKKGTKIYIGENHLEFEVKQCNYSFNEKKGTLRGMHYQNPPFLEKKIVTCLKGKVYDVVVDLRKDSKTYLKWEGFELSEQNLHSLYIPEGLAHGFVTIEDNSFLFYEMSEFYVKGQERGVRYNDPKIGIIWPNVSVMVISDKDLHFELL